MMGPSNLRGDDVRKSHELLKKRNNKCTEFKDESSQGTESYNFNKSYGTNDLSKMESMVRISHGTSSTAKNNNKSNRDSGKLFPSS